MTKISFRERCPDHNARAPSRQDSGYASARGSYSNASTSTADYNGNFSQPYNGNHPPPPPPLHLRKPLVRSVDSSPSDDPVRVHGRVSGTLHDIHANGIHQANSPMSPTSAEGCYENNGRKHGKKQEPMRQADDVTPKLKRRQPHVADAYRYVSVWNI